jgi:ATP-dependent Lon protease
MAGEISLRGFVLPIAGRTKEVSAAEYSVNKIRQEQTQAREHDQEDCRNSHS